MHDAEVRGGGAGDGDGGDGDVGFLLDVLVDDFAVIHAVELVSAEDDEVLVGALEEVAEIAADGIGGALVPMGAARGLLCCEDLDEGAGELIELVCGGDVSDKGGAIELGEDVHLPQV